MRGTLLMAAVATQQMELIELLLSGGASVHVTDAFGCTALSSASCPLDHQPNRAKLARGALPTASRQVCHRVYCSGRVRVRKSRSTAACHRVYCSGRVRVRVGLG